MHQLERRQREGGVEHRRVAEMAEGLPDIGLAETPCGPRGTRGSPAARCWTERGEMCRPPRPGPAGAQQGDPPGPRDCRPGPPRSRCRARPPDRASSEAVSVRWPGVPTTLPSITRPAPRPRSRSAALGVTAVCRPIRPPGAMRSAPTRLRDAQAAFAAELGRQQVHHALAQPGQLGGRARDAETAGWPRESGSMAQECRLWRTR